MQHVWAAVQRFANEGFGAPDTSQPATPPATAAALPGSVDQAMSKLVLVELVTLLLGDLFQRAANPCLLFLKQLGKSPVSFRAERRGFWRHKLSFPLLPKST